MQKCADCGRVVSLQDGTCYYCRDTPASNEADVKMMLINMAREQEESAGSDALFRVSKFISFVCGILFLAASFSGFFDKRVFFFVCGLMFFANSWILDRSFAKSIGFCLMVSGVSAVYSLSVGVNFLRGAAKDFNVAFSAVALAIIAIVPALVMIFNIEKERRKK